jgi:hypothetical protein
MSRSLQVRGSLHNIMLPRTWLLNLCPSHVQLANKEFRVLPIFLFFVRVVLASIDSISKGGIVHHLLYQGKSLSDIGPLIRNLYVLRV